MYQQFDKSDKEQADYTKGLTNSPHTEEIFDSSIEYFDGDDFFEEYDFENDFAEVTANHKMKGMDTNTRNMMLDFEFNYIMEMTDIYTKPTIVQKIDNDDMKYTNFNVGFEIFTHYLFPIFRGVSVDFESIKKQFFNDNIIKKLYKLDVISVLEDTNTTHTTSELNFSGNTEIVTIAKVDVRKTPYLDIHVQKSTLTSIKDYQTCVIYYGLLQHFLCNLLGRVPRQISINVASMSLKDCDMQFMIAFQDNYVRRMPNPKSEYKKLVHLSDKENLPQLKVNNERLTPHLINQYLDSEKDSDACKELASLFTLENYSDNQHYSVTLK